MNVIGPQGPNGRSSSRSRTQLTYSRMTAKARVISVLVFAWAAFVALTLPSFSIANTLVVVVAPIIGVIGGGIKGLSLGYFVALQAISGPVLLPTLSAALLGAIAGFLSGWLGRAFPGKQNKLTRSFISSFFSPEMLRENAAGFGCHLIASTATGLAVSVILSSVGVFDHTTQIGESWQVILGGGPGDYPLGDSLLGVVLAIFYMLGALLIACGIVGMGVGAALGGLIGAGFSSIGIPTVVGGASEGLLFRFFAPYRPEQERSGRLVYFFTGAGIGAAEGLLVGFGTGAVLFVAQILSIVG